MNVPKLRFDEFNDEWKKEKLNKHASFLQGLTYNPKDISEEGVIVLRSSNIQNSSISYNDIIKVNINIPEKLKIHENDILMCVRNGSKKLVGKTALLGKNEEKCTWGAFMNIIRPVENNKFIYYYLNSLYFYKHIWKDLGTATVNQITKQTLDSFKLSIPTVNEQEKIGNMLSLLDKKIELQSKKIEALKLYKKGLIDKIYLMDIYDKITLKNLFNSYGGTSLESYVSDKGTYNFISIGNYSMDGEYINNNQKIVLNDKTKDKLLNKNDLVMILNDKTSSGDIIGSTILIDENNKYIYNQRSQRLVCKKEILPEYAWCYLNTSKHRRKVFSHSQGGTQIYINFSQIEKMQVLLPKDFKNQKIISTIIIDTCNKIKLNEIKLKELRKLKKGLMQNMFV